MRCARETSSLSRCQKHRHENKTAYQCSVILGLLSVDAMMLETMLLSNTLTGSRLRLFCTTIRRQQSSKIPRFKT